MKDISRYSKTERLAMEGIKALSKTERLRLAGIKPLSKTEKNLILEETVTLEKLKLLERLKSDDEKGLVLNRKPRIALCLFGIIGGREGKDGLGGVIDFEFCYEHYKKNIIDPNDTDVFIHTWSIEHQEPLQRLYNPKMATYEPQKDFYSNIHSRWYSHNKSLKLRQIYENQYKIKYDFVLVSRFDLLWFEKIDFNSLDRNYFYLANNNKFPSEKGHLKNKKYSKDNNTKQVSDLWFIGHPFDMDKTMNIYNSIEKRKTNINIHKFLGEYFRDWINKKYIFYRGTEFELYRWKILNKYT